MQDYLIVLVSEAGQRVAEAIGGEVIAVSDVRAHWHGGRTMVFIGAMGICVRTIAPLIVDKHHDPAVVCVDSTGVNVIPVLSGHVGGANNVAREIAAKLHAHAAITTLTDNLGLWSLDTLAATFGWAMATEQINEQIALYTHMYSGEVIDGMVALLLTVADEGTAWMEAHAAVNMDVYHRFEDLDFSDYEFVIAVTPYDMEHCPVPVVHYIPRCLHLGIGLAHQASPAQDIIDDIFDTLWCDGLCREAVSTIATADIKADEPVIKALGAMGYDVVTYSAEALSAVDVPSPSDVVARHVGTPSVCEAAALLSSRGELIVRKEKGEQWTLAVALSESVRCAPRQVAGVEFVGAGPGAPDLLSVRGRSLLEEADLILYAGSLVPKAVTECAKPTAVVISSATMTLEEQVSMMVDCYRRGELVVRLHTGDPCLYGAISEQMALLDAAAVPYRITPGISAFQAAAAALQSQFTIPRRTQTIILTRGEGRTPMPDGEQLRLLARSHSTMCIYLSADIVERVQEELLCEYDGSTPVAVCYRLTWPEQAIYRGVLSDLVSIVRGHDLTLDTLIVVGEAIGNRTGTSELYSPSFTHLYRKGEV